MKSLTVNIISADKDSEVTPSVDNYTQLISYILEKIDKKDTRIVYIREIDNSVGELSDIVRCFGKDPNTCIIIYLDTPISRFKDEKTGKVKQLTQLQKNILEEGFILEYDRIIMNDLGYKFHRFNRYDLSRFHVAIKELYILKNDIGKLVINYINSLNSVSKGEK